MSRFVWSCLLVLLLAANARAEDANSYGARGRTIVAGGLGGWYSNLRAPDDFGHHYNWGLGATLTLVHFWRDNVGLGGTLVGNWYRLNETDTESGLLYQEMGADLDGVYHVALSRRLSLRAWIWLGVRYGRSIVSSRVYGSGLAFVDPPPYFLRPGVSLELLFHLSPSIALSTGPGFAARIRLNGQGETQYELQFAPRLSYSFGATEENEKRLEDAREFSRRGRKVLSLSGSFGGLFPHGRSDFGMGAGLVRFVTDGIGVGVFASGGLVSFQSSDDEKTAGGGLQTMFDVRLAKSVSLLVVPQLGYLWRKRTLSDRYAIGITGQRAGFPAYAHGGFELTSHELRAMLPAYLALHLNQGLVLGLGPYALLVQRVGKDRDLEPNARYISGGVTSLIAASF